MDALAVAVENELPSVKIEVDGPGNAICETTITDRNTVGHGLHLSGAETLDGRRGHYFGGLASLRVSRECPLSQ